MTAPHDASAPVEVARGLFDAYLEQDRAAAERLVADTFSFTSPQDDHIDRAAYFDRCFPTASRLRSQTLLHAVEIDPTHVFIAYEYELQNGQGYRNTEIHTVQDGAATEVQVFFGGPANT